MTIETVTEGKITFRAEIPWKPAACRPAFRLRASLCVPRVRVTASRKPPEADFISATSSMNLPWGTKMKQKKQPTLKLNEERIDEAVLALLYLNLYHCGVVWKGFDWDAMNRLHEKGLISDPVRKAKSVGFSEEGEKQARKIFEEMFVINKI
jgi:hypothetical protein